MKYIYGLLLGCLFLVGCSEDEAVEKEKTKQIVTEENQLTDKEKQEAIIEYINGDVQNVARYEMEAFHVMESVQGENYVDDQTTYDALVNEIIPFYEKAIEEAKSLKPTIDELELPLKLMVDATETFHEGLILQKESFEKQDINLQEQAAAKFEDYFAIVEEYHSEMEEICKKYNVVYERETPATVGSE